jgi:DNA polymerase alpha subunit A
MIVSAGILIMKEPSLPTDITGKTFSRVFGTNASPLELFILKRKLIGPGWLKIKADNISKAKVANFMIL